MGKAEEEAEAKKRGSEKKADSNASEVPDNRDLVERLVDGYRAFKRMLKDVFGEDDHTHWHSSWREEAGLSADDKKLAEGDKASAPADTGEKDWEKEERIKKEKKEAKGKLAAHEKMKAYVKALKSATKHKDEMPQYISKESKRLAGLMADKDKLPEGKRDEMRGKLECYKSVQMRARKLARSQRQEL